MSSRCPLSASQLNTPLVAPAFCTAMFMPASTSPTVSAMVAAIDACEA
jgi:hypothetical protein